MIKCTICAGPVLQATLHWKRIRDSESASTSASEKARYSPCNMHQHMLL